MVILGLGALWGLALGLAVGGRVRALARLRFRAPLLLWPAAGLQLGAGWLAPSRRPLAVGLAYAVVGAWLLLNAAWHAGPIRAALGLLALGWVLNGVPIVANGGMPVSMAALRQVGAPATVSVRDGHLFKHVPASRDTVLVGLGDVVPVPALRTVVSVGDLVMVVAVMLVVAFAMAGDGGALRAPPHPPLAFRRSR